MNSKKVDYSIVIPVYFNEGCLIGTMESIRGEVFDKNPQYTCEIIFVDDGSGDRSFEELLQIQKQYPETVKLIKLTRNFGQCAALLAGFSHAKGKCIIMMSADGQDPPELINDMLKAYFEEGYEIAVCTRKNRDESFYRIVTSRFFYSLMRKLTFPNMPKGGFDFLLLGERSLKVFLRNMDVNPFFQGQVLWMGFKTKFIEYNRQQRISGESRWTFGKKLTYLIDGVLSYSFSPIRLCSLAGIVIALLGFLYALDIFIEKLFFSVPIQGWAPLMIGILVIGGVQLVMLGVIGEYVWRTLAQTRNRDMYVVDAIFDSESSSTSN